MRLLFCANFRCNCISWRRTPLFRLASLFGLLLLAGVVLLQTFLLITMSCIITTRRFIWRGLRLLSLLNLGVHLFICLSLGIMRGLLLRRGIDGLADGIVTGFTVGCLRSRKPIFAGKEPICWAQKWLSWTIWQRFLLLVVQKTLTLRLSLRKPLWSVVAMWWKNFLVVACGLLANSLVSKWKLKRAPSPSWWCRYPRSPLVWGNGSLGLSLWRASRMPWISWLASKILRSIKLIRGFGTVGWTVFSIFSMIIELFFIWETKLK
jgi:hypothetical protein